MFPNDFTLFEAEADSSSWQVESLFPDSMIGDVTVKTGEWAEASDTQAEAKCNQAQPTNARGREARDAAQVANKSAMATQYNYLPSPDNFILPLEGLSNVTSNGVSSLPMQSFPYSYLAEQTDFLDFQKQMWYPNSRQLTGNCSAQQMSDNLGNHQAICLDDQLARFPTTGLEWGYGHGHPSVDAHGHPSFDNSSAEQEYDGLVAQQRWSYASAQQPQGYIPAEQISAISTIQQPRICADYQQPRHRIPFHFVPYKASRHQNYRRGVPKKEQDENNTRAEQAWDLYHTAAQTQTFCRICGGQLVHLGGDCSRRRTV
ncbi:hypothetical protein K461DRAFT_307145 [Myriangium duriaei CBS 260.36]|uniref:Uncharacterized protein n=1 Tax=Myriangium duriaei CBS 260.36 TaxID=1168546 RepID=A0A9P4IZW2_9PEZI|nr:hypothetical protein K461DRAFT_307145 [Myriangium duriaei CBS 260.36]